MTTETLPTTKNLSENQDNLLPTLERERFELAQREAKLLATSTIIPDSYRGNMGNCFIAVHTARRLDIDPIMFMQRSYVVHGKISLEGQLVIALINKRGPYVENLKWKVEGEKDKLKVTCIGVKANGESDTLSLSMEDVKKMGWDSKNPLWKNMPEQMLHYRTATWLARRHCPEVLVGFSLDDEEKEIRGVSIQSGASAKLNEALNITDEVEDAEIVEDKKAEVDL